MFPRMLKFLVAVFFLFTIGLHAQEASLDSLLRIIKLPIDSPLRSNQVRLLGEKLKDIDKDFLDSQYDKLIPYFEQAVIYAQSKNDSEAMLRNKVFLIEIYSKLNMDKEILILGDELLSYQALKEMPEYTSFLANLYDCYRGLEMYGEMLQVIPLIYEVQDRFGEEIVTAGYSFKYDAAMVYYKLQNYEEAIKGFLRQALIFEEIGDQLFKSSMINNIGLCYEKMRSYDKARDYYNLALEELAIPNKKGVESKSPEYREYFKRVIQANIAEIEMHNGNIDIGIKAFKAELSYSFKNKEYPIVTGAYLNLAEAYYLKNDPKTAHKYIDSCLQVMSIYDATSTRIAAYDLKGKILLLKGDVNGATENFKIQDRIEDSINTINASRNYMIAATKFDSENQNKELEATREEMAITKKLKSYQWIALLAAAILLSIVAFFYWNARKAKKIISIQNRSLESSLSEKEILLKEVHHRVKNNLQVISGLLQLQARKSDSLQMENILQDSQRHIHSMSLVHEMLYDQEDLAVVPMGDYIKKLTDQLFYSLSGKNIKCHVEADAIDLSIERAIPLGLMISELVTNANKYAFTGVEEGDIWVTLSRKQNDTFQFTYRDNGAGLPEDFDMQTSKTLGFKLIHLLTDEMDAAIQITGKEGVHVIITFSEKTALSYV